jgi:hypothetical protein
MKKSTSHRAMSTLAAIVIGAAAALVPASPALAATWSVVPTPASSYGFSGVDAVNATNVWAVGGGGLAGRWNGTAWTATSTPLPGALLLGVDGSAPDNVWAVGSTGSGTLTERWNGASWSVVPSPNPPDATWSLQLNGVKAFSGSDAWAVGSYSAAAAPVARTVIQRWDGTAWSIVPSPNPDTEVNLLTDVDGAASNDVWAIGNLGHEIYGGTPRRGLVLHWNGSAWSQVNVPGTTSDGTINFPTLEDVFVVSANDVWIVGRAFSWTVFKIVPIALHWNGVTWQRSVLNTAPNDGTGFVGVAALSPTQVYAVGKVIARWTGAAWTLDSASVPTGGNLVDMAAVGPSTFWAVGSAGTGGTLAVRTTNGPGRAAWILTRSGESPHGWLADFAHAY